MRLGLRNIRVGGRCSGEPSPRSGFSIAVVLALTLMNEDKTNVPLSLFTDGQLQIVVAELRTLRSQRGWMAAMPWAISALSIVATVGTAWFSMRLSNIQIQQATANLTSIEIECETQPLRDEKGPESSPRQIAINYKCRNDGTLPVAVIRRKLVVWVGSPSPLEDDTKTLVLLNPPGETGAIVWTKRVIDRDLGRCTASPKIEVNESISWSYKSSSATVVYVEAEMEMDDGTVRTVSKWSGLK